MSRLALVRPANLAMANARARVIGARVLLANACNALEAARRLVAQAEDEVAAAELEELAARAAEGDGR